MNTFIKTKELEIDREAEENLVFLCGQYLKHKFDLLGSGPQRIFYGMEAPGFHGRKYICRVPLIRSKRDYGRMAAILPLRDVFRGRKFLERLREGYQPIDWHIDYKSGFRFSALRYRTIEQCNYWAGKLEGVEIKMPWELGRLYHFPQMAVCALFREELRESLIREFLCELYDFMIANPCGRTIQWSAVMDCSIRAVNLLTAFDIFSQIDKGGEITEKVKAEFEQWILQHGRYIVNHLEYARIASNHYLSNLAGLIYIAAYSEQSAETDAWLVFATQELIAQIRLQFHEEGSHFEGSTSYHRLSTEFCLLSAALIYGVLRTPRRKAFRNYQADLTARLLPPRRQKYRLEEELFFPKDCLERLYRAVCFTKAVSRPDGRIVQVGDNDSGRLLKLTPLGSRLTGKAAREKYINLRQVPLEGEIFDEDIINHSTLIGYGKGLYGGAEFDCRGVRLEESFVRSVAGENHFEFCPRTFPMPAVSYRSATDLLYEKEKVFLLGTPAGERLNWQYYGQFGLVLIQGQGIFISIVVDTMKNTKLFGHMHNDALSLEIFADQKCLTGDPGGYVYTPSLKMRNMVRSTAYHNTVFVKGREQNVFAGYFGLQKKSRAEIILWQQRTVGLEAVYMDVVHQRFVTVGEDRVTVRDRCNKPFRVRYENQYFSNGYGRMEKIK